MSEWIEQFENHAVHESLRSTLAAVGAILASSSELEAASIEKLDRIQQVLTVAQARLESVDPALVPLQVLQHLDGSIGKIEQALSTFDAGTQPEHLILAHNQLENLLVSIADIPVPMTANDVEGIREAVTGLRRSFGQNVRHHEEQAEALNQTLQQLTQKSKGIESRLEASEKQVVAAISAAQEKLSEQQEERSSAATTAEAERSENWKKFVSEQEEAWATIVAEKRSEYEELNAELTKKFEELTAGFESTISDNVDELSKKSEEILKTLDTRKAEAARIVGVITDTGMVGGYQREANSAKWAATFWRFTALTGLIGLITFAIVIFINGLKQPDPSVISWPVIGWRVFVASAFGLFAAYAARQADKHDRTRRTNRKMELELASISPYLQDLPEDKIIEIKMELAKKMFGQAEATIAPDKKTTGTLTDVIEMAMETIKSMASK